MIKKSFYLLHNDSQRRAQSPEALLHLLLAREHFGCYLNFREHESKATFPRGANEEGETQTKPMSGCSKYPKC